MRSAYEDAIESLSAVGGDLTENRHQAVRKLADYTWEKLEAATREFAAHCRSHYETKAAITASE
jgi:hypothetical protein